MNKLHKITYIALNIFLKINASLMMEAEEVSAINEIISENSFKEQDEWVNFNSLIKKETKNIKQHELIYLGAILYFDKNHWTVWINDQPFTNESRENNAFKVLKISKNTAEIKLKNYNHLKPVKLNANQTLTNPEDCNVVDGDARKTGKHTAKEQL